MRYDVQRYATDRFPSKKFTGYDAARVFTHLAS